MSSINPTAHRLYSVHYNRLSMWEREFLKHIVTIPFHQLSIKQQKVLAILERDYESREKMNELLRQGEELAMNLSDGIMTAQKFLYNLREAINAGRDQ